MPMSPDGRQDTPTQHVFREAQITDLLVFLAVASLECRYFMSLLMAHLLRLAHRVLFVEEFWPF